MQTFVQAKEFENPIAKVIETQEDLEKLQQHFKEVVEGAAFKGSQRSRQFLTYVLEQTIAGHCADLKERIIGVDLFGRSPAYDTGEDAIVRVTASDVRKRLLAHYAKAETISEFRINLPSGHYIPEILRDTSVAPPNTSVLAIPEDSVARAEPSGTPFPDPANVPANLPGKGWRNFKWMTFALLLLVLNLAAWVVVSRFRSGAVVYPASVLPWSALFQKQHPVLLITSDPNIAEIQGLTGTPVTVSDYANQVYLPASKALSPEIVNFSRDILRGDKAANVDTSIVASVAEMAEASASKINIRGARDLRFSDLDTDNNFIFIGSPRTDPWTNLFSDQLDFRFIWEKPSQQEIIQNVHPHTGELKFYVPTAKGLATGESYATISFVGNPDHTGQVLILAGANAEGTRATGELITNLHTMPIVLKRCGISAQGPVQHFQLLLRLSTMAGSPRHFDIMACHILP
jgi:hypothetical protein